MCLDAELAVRSASDDAWADLGAASPVDPRALGAHLRVTEWATASAADRKLFQAPFRAGIRLDAHQLLPLQKALDLPRANLLIADDVGARQNRGGRPRRAGAASAAAHRPRGRRGLGVDGPAMTGRDGPEVRPGPDHRRPRASRAHPPHARVRGRPVGAGLVLRDLALGPRGRSLRRPASRHAGGVPPPLAPHPGRGASRRAFGGRRPRHREPYDPLRARPGAALRAPPVRVGDPAQRALELLRDAARDPGPPAVHAGHRGRAGRPRARHGPPPEGGPAPARRAIPGAAR